MVAVDGGASRQQQHVERTVGGVLSGCNSVSRPTEAGYGVDMSTRDAGTTTPWRTACTHKDMDTHPNSQPHPPARRERLGRHCLNPLSISQPPGRIAARPADVYVRPYDTGRDVRTRRAEGCLLPPVR